MDCNFLTLLPYSILPLGPTCKGTAPLTPGHSLRRISKPAHTLMQTYTGSGPGTPSFSCGASVVLQEPRGRGSAGTLLRSDAVRPVEEARSAGTGLTGWKCASVRLDGRGGRGRVWESPSARGTPRSVTAMLSNAETSSCYVLNASLEYFVNIKFCIH